MAKSKQYTVDSVMDELAEKAKTLCMDYGTHDGNESLSDNCSPSQIKKMMGFFESSFNELAAETLATNFLSSFSDPADWDTYDRDEVISGLTTDLKKMHSKVFTGDKMSSKVKNKVKETALKVVEVAKDDTKEIALRHSAKQLAKAVQKPLVNILIQNLQLEGDPSMKTKIAAFLSTDIGFALLQGVVSVGVGMLPVPGHAKETLNQLAREMRIQAEMSVSEPVVEMLMEPVRNLLSEQVLSLPVFKEAPQLTEGSSVSVKTKKTTKVEVV